MLIVNHKPVLDTDEQVIIDQMRLYAQYLDIGHDLGEEQKTYWNQHIELVQSYYWQLHMYWNLFDTL